MNNFEAFYQHKKHSLDCVVSRSSQPFKNDLIARCSEAYVIKDANIIPPTTIRPNLKNRAVIPKIHGKDGATITRKAIPNP